MKGNNCFNNKVVVITGSSQGIGLELAGLFAQAGARVVINGRSEEKLKGVARNLLEKGFQVTPLVADITKADQCQSFVEKVIENLGGIDILINNGGLTMKEDLERIDVDTFAEVFTSNSLGAVYMTKAVLPFIKQRKGSVVLISSIGGFHGLPSASAYCMGKMALTSFWQSLKLELAGTGIHVGICYLGFTENDPQKRMISANGILIEVPQRPWVFTQRKQRVAQKILQSVQYRKSKQTFSALGKFCDLLFRLTPRLVLFLMKITLRNKSNKTE